MKRTSLPLQRREFILALGGAAAWPLAAGAQQPAKLPTIGYLGSGTRASQRPWVAAFGQRLGELGWIEGRTVPESSFCPLLFDQIVGANEDRRRQGQAKRPCGVDVKYQIDFHCLLHRQISRLFALENAACVMADQTKRIG